MLLQNNIDRMAIKKIKKIKSSFQAMWAPGREAVMGPAVVVNGIPLYVQTPPANGSNRKIHY